MINQECSWQHIKNNAQKAVMTKMVLHSLVRNSKYTVSKVLDNKIVIKRSGKGKNQDLTRKTVEKAITKLNQVGQFVKRGKLMSPSVAEETAFVLFHPQLRWSKDGKVIIKLKG